MNDLKAVTDADVDIIGRDVAGRYRVLAKIGEGGMGAVYRAEQISLKRTVALKLLKPSLVSTPMLLRRFNAEAEAVAKLNHPNTVGIYDFGQDSDGSLFIAMEFVDGQSLRKVVGREAPLPPQRALYIAAQIAASLSDAHNHGIVHRDLKPDNVMLQDRGKHSDIARVLDFGIAKLRDDSRATAMTQAGDMLGTPQYMSPEQIKGEAIDGRTDVYALAAMLYELLTGRMVFESTTVLSILSKHLMEMPAPPSARRPDLGLSLELDQLVMAGLAKDPAHRFASMEQFGDAMMQVAATLAPMQFGGRVPAITPPAQPAVGTPLPAGHGAPTPTSNSNAPATVASVYAAPVPAAPARPPADAAAVPSMYAPGAQRPLVSSPAPAQPNLYASAAATAPVPASGASLAQTSPRPQVAATQVVERAQPARKSRLPLVIAAVVVLGGGGAGAYWYLDKPAKPDPWSVGGSTPSPSPQPTPPQPTPPQPTPPQPVTGSQSDPWAGDPSLPNNVVPKLNLQLPGKLIANYGFKVHLPPGFTEVDNSPEPLPDGAGMSYGWEKTDEQMLILVVDVHGAQSNFDEIAARVGFRPTGHWNENFSGTMRPAGSYFANADSDVVVANGAYFLHGDRTFGVFVIYQASDSSAGVQLRNEVFNQRFSW
jgi:serine/threonine-protein kinase